MTGRLPDLESSSNWQSLLPIASLTSFLPAFCNCWKQKTNALDCLGGVLLPASSPRIPATLFLSDHSDPLVVSEEQSEQLSSRGFATICEKIWPISNTDSVHRIPIGFPETENFFSGVVLSLPPGADQPFDSENIASLVRESFPLIRQAVWMERAIQSPEVRAELEREKFEAMAEFAAGAGHEINNPVATIYGRAQQLLLGESDSERRQQLLTIGAQALRIRDMIGDTMLFARPPKPAMQFVDLAEIVRTETAVLREAAASRNASLTIEAEAAAAANVDRSQFCVVLHALVRNSLEALKSNGAVTVSVTAIVEGGVPYVRLTVIDNGSGLSEKDRRHAFDPFYSGRQAGRGLGFGLSKSRRILEQHGGYLQMQSPAGLTVIQADWPVGGT